MPVMLIFLAILVLLIWGNLSRKSPSHPLNNLGSVNPVTPVNSTADTVGDNFNSGCSFVAGVGEPDHAVMCGSLPTCHAIVAHFPIDPPPIAIQKTPPTPVIGLPTRTAPLPDVPVVAAPKQIFPVPVGYHNNVVPARQITNPVLLRQNAPTTPVINAKGQLCKTAMKLGIYRDAQGRWHIGSVGVGGRYVPKIGQVCDVFGNTPKTGINYTA